MQSPMYNGFFLPNFSNRGPYTNCPTEMPIKKLDNDNITCSTDVYKLTAIAGNAGRYMSIENGPIAVSKPSMRIR